MSGSRQLVRPASVFQGISLEKSHSVRSIAFLNKLAFDSFEVMKVLAIIEKSSDGLYSIYSDDHIGKSYFGGFGDSVAQAKEDFLVSIKEAISEESEKGQSTPKLDDIVVTYKYDLPSFFNCFDFINVSKFAELAGVNESKMRAYKCGVSFPGEKTTAKILKAIQHIGSEFCSISL